MKEYLLMAQLVGVQNTPYYFKTKEGSRKLKNFLKAAYGNLYGIRLLPFFPTGHIWDYKKKNNKYVAFPWFSEVYKGKWTWNLEKYNEEYFNLLDVFIYTLNKAGLHIVFDLIDYCESFVPQFRKISPLWNNKQNVKFGDPQFTEYIKDYTDRILKILEYNAPYDFSIEIGNEIYAGEKGAEFVKEMSGYLIKKGLPKSRIIIPTSVIGGDYLHNIARAGRQLKNGKIPFAFRTLTPALHLGAFGDAKYETLIHSEGWEWLKKSFDSIWLSTDGVGSLHNLGLDIKTQVEALNKMIEITKNSGIKRIFLEIQSGYYWWAEEDEFKYERPHYRLKYLSRIYFEDIVRQLKADTRAKVGDLDKALKTIDNMVKVHTPSRWFTLFKDIIKNIFKK